MGQWISDTLMIATIGFIAYVLCVAVDRKTIGQMVILVAVLLFANKTMTDIKPIVDKLNAIKEVKDKIGNYPILDWAPGTGILEEKQKWAK